MSACLPVGQSGFIYYYHSWSKTTGVFGDFVSKIFSGILNAGDIYSLESIYISHDDVPHFGQVVFPSILN